MGIDLVRIAKEPVILYYGSVRRLSPVFRLLLLAQARLHGGKAEISKRIIIEHPVRFQGMGKLVIGESVSLGYALAGAGKLPILFQPRELQALIQIGAGSAIMNGCEFFSRSEICLGEGCMIGPETLFVDADFHGIRPDERHLPGKTAPIILDEQVWTGSRSMILKGVHIGREAVIAAGAVVTRDVPAGVIIAGNPGREVGSVYA